tara:strand:- start:243 stop:566 length:324 start_codon:yes stop_codon:yes gene_type:complete
MKIKLNINVKDKTLNKKLQVYVDGEIEYFQNSDDIIRIGKDFDLRYKKFLSSKMNKGQEVDKDIIEYFIKDCLYRYDMDVNGTDEEPYHTFGKRFNTIATKLKRVIK